MNEEYIKEAIKQCYDDMARRGGWVDWDEYSKRSLKGLLSCIEVYGIDKKDAHIVLDVGAGAGRYSAFLKARQHWNMIGCDFSRDLCLNAKEAYPEVPFVCGDTEKLPFKDECADIVISVGLVECLQNPTKMFTEIQRILKTNGVGIVRVINKLSVSGILETLLNKVGKTLWGCYPEFYQYSFSSIKRMTGNFDKVEFYGCRLLDRYWIRAFRLLEPVIMPLERKLRRSAFIYDSYFVLVKKRDKNGGG